MARRLQASCTEIALATVPNARVEFGDPRDLVADSTIPLDSLPFPAAIADPSGAFCGANRAWIAASPEAAPGSSVLDWCKSVHNSAALENELTAGVESVLRGVRTRFAQDSGSPSGRWRIAVSSCPGGALILRQHFTAGDRQPQQDERKWQSQKMETVGRLVGGVAHDFANLLTLIAGYSDMLLNRIGAKDPIRPELDEIREAADRGARLTAQLLGFTRGQSVKPRPIDLNAVITDMERMLRPIIGEHVQLHTNLSPGLGRVVADPGQMEQVLMNLILNARDAMPKGGRIEIETVDGDLAGGIARARGLRGDVVLFSVADNGHGIDPESMRHMFEPFFTTKEEGKGTGLGLSTVYGIVKQSGGDIWVSSAPGQGARFTICLPRAADRPERPSSASSPHPSAQGSETVLLVEDEDGVRRLIATVLSKRGYKVLQAANGAEALEIFKERADEIHLVLTDMVMPRMSGRELASAVTSIRPNARIMFMSGYTDDVLVRTGALGPGMSFLQKPLRPDVLTAKVREALDS